MRIHPLPPVPRSLGAVRPPGPTAPRILFEATEKWQEVEEEAWSLSKSLAMLGLLWGPTLGALHWGWLSSVLLWLQKAFWG